MHATIFAKTLIFTIFKYTISQYILYSTALSSKTSTIFYFRPTHTNQHFILKSLHFIYFLQRNIYQRFARFNFIFQLTTKSYINKLSLTASTTIYMSSLLQMKQILEITWELYNLQVILFVWKYNVPDTDPTQHKVIIISRFMSSFVTLLTCPILTPNTKHLLENLVHILASTNAPKMLLFSHLIKSIEFSIIYRAYKRTNNKNIFVTPWNLKNKYVYIRKNYQLSKQR